MSGLTNLTRRLRSLADAADEAAWPAEALAALTDAGCWAQAVPQRFGGAGAPPVERLATYEAVAAGSMAAALILTQHDAACELLADGDNEALAARLLSNCAAGSLLATVGISQLTTSRQTGAPAMRALPCPDGHRLSGTMPWVTSASRCSWIVTGGVRPDQCQILACIPSTASGLVLGAPLRLLALEAAVTSEVTCQDVAVGAEHLLRGPCPQVLARRAPTKSLTVSAVGVGVAGAILEGLRAATPPTTEMERLMASTIEPQYRAARARLFQAAALLNDPGADVSVVDIRAGVNALVARMAATLVTLLKGTGYLAAHPLQRLAREALFLLVWSAPPAVQVRTLERIWSAAPAQAGT